MRIKRKEIGLVNNWSYFAIISSWNQLLSSAIDNCLPFWFNRGRHHKQWGRINLKRQPCLTLMEKFYSLTVRRDLVYGYSGVWIRSPQVWSQFCYGRRHCFSFTLVWLSPGWHVRFSVTSGGRVQSWFGGEGGLRQGVFKLAPQPIGEQCQRIARCADRWMHLSLHAPLSIACGDYFLETDCLPRCCSPKIHLN